MKTLVSAVMAALPNPAPAAPPGVEPLVNMLLGWLKYGGGAAVIAGFIVLGSTLAIENNTGQASEKLKRVMYISIGAIIIGSAAGLAGALLQR